MKTICQHFCKIMHFNGAILKQSGFAKWLFIPKTVTNERSWVFDK